VPQTKKTSEAIFDAAAKLFYKHGYKATGVEAIAQAANITKATLYHHFTNKDALIEGTLRYLSDYHRRGYIEVWNKEGLQPINKLTILFDEMTAFFKEDECYGCPFINAAGEYTERECGVRKICQEHYQFIIDHLEQFARDAELKQPRLVAEKITNIIAGTYTSWYVSGIFEAARQGKEIANMIIKYYKKETT
jgi:AcrR family transcriptional regulator